MDPQYQEISERVNEEIEKKIVHLSEADFKQQYRFVKELGYGTFGWNSLYKDTATEKDVITPPFSSFVSHPISSFLGLHQNCCQVTILQRCIA